MKKIIYIISSAFLVVSCESTTFEEISDNTPITETVRYEKDIKPIVEANCMGCHSTLGSASYRPLTNYNEVKANIDIIINRIQRQNGDLQKMPQGGSLSASQINLFVQWKSDGLTEN